MRLRKSRQSEPFVRVWHHLLGWPPAAELPRNAGRRTAPVYPARKRQSEV